MKKFLIPLLCMYPMSVFALDFVSDVSVTSGSTTFSYDQGGDKFKIEQNGLAAYFSDDVALGLEYTSTLLEGAGVSVSAHYEYTEEDDSVIGITSGFEQFGVVLNAAVDWNVNDSDVSAKLGTGYSILGIDGALTSKWDVDDFSYEGMDVTAGYTWNVTDTFSVRPNVTVPFDDDFTRGDLTAGVSISLSFGSTSSE